MKPKFTESIWPIIQESFFNGIVAWSFSALIACCTLTSSNVLEWSWVKTIHEYVGTLSSILIIFLLLISRITWVSISKYLELRRDKQRSISSEKLTEMLFDCLIELNAAKHCEPEKVLEHLNDFIDKAKRLFDKVTDSKCCVSVKVCMDEAESDDKRKLSQLIVRNVLRDSGHQRERDTEQYKSKEHSVFENTAYTVVINNINKTKYCYVCNDIKAMGDNYMNTSIGCFGEEGLPYESEIVTSLRDNHNLKRFRGFLCVDSDKTNAFDKGGLELIYLRIIADTLFGVVPVLREI